MMVRCEGDTVWLEGACHVEEAEVLAGRLAAGVAQVDLSRCSGLHGAVAQVLLAWRPALKGAPKDAFLNEYLLPALGYAAPVATSGDGDARSDLSRGGGDEGTEGASI